MILKKLNSYYLFTSITKRKTMENLKINWLAIIVATIGAQAIGAGVYGTFSEQWLEFHKLDMAFVEANQSATPFIVSIVASVILYYIMALVFQKMGIDNLGDGFKWGLLMGLAFGFLGPYTQGHFEFNVYSGLLDGFNNFLGILLGGIILGAWTKKG